MTLQEFINRNTNVFIDVDHAFGAQCWDLVAAFNRDVVGEPAPFAPTVGGTILSSFVNFPNPLPQYFDRVYNNAKDPNQVPPVGSIVFFAFNHAGIVVASDSRQFTLFEQNNPVGAPAHLITHPASAYLSVVGWLVPKKFQAPQPNIPTSRTATVTVNQLNVRSGPGTNYPVTSLLVVGNTFQYTDVVSGQNVNGNDQWVHSTLGHYVWTGGLSL